jgi:hypothetical protein
VNDKIANLKIAKPKLMPPWVGNISNLKSILTDGGIDMVVLRSVIVRRRNIEDINPFSALNLISEVKLAEMIPTLSKQAAMTYK